MNGEVKGAKYAEDKPKDCAYCYFWSGKRKGCTLGEENCYYLLREAPKEKTECDGCPYKKGGPCIGWCTKKVMDKKGDAK